MKKSESKSSVHKKEEPAPAKEAEPAAVKESEPSVHEKIEATE